MEIELFQVDAFTDVPFGGNPAAVCPLEEWLDNETLQAIAAENNLSETAFFTPRDDGSYDLRWFTPTVEVDLCGHATLASAWVVFNELSPDASSVTFHSKSGQLHVARHGEELALDFPASSLTEAEPEDGLETALGGVPTEWRKSSCWVAVFETAADVEALDPDVRAMSQLEIPVVSVTAPGTGVHEDVDFVSRFFAPGAGIDEDPVTGSAHCWLGPYWAERLGRAELSARQISRRGGELRLVPRGERVEIVGNAVTVLRGTLSAVAVRSRK